MPQVMINPRSPDREIEKFLMDAPFPNHYWFCTSGSQKMKWVALSKDALIESAKAVNSHLNSTKSDRWIHTLPEFHVGGMGIRMRAELSQADVLRLDEWTPFKFVETTKNNRGTLSALVPAQVFDLVKQGLKSPETLRGVIVGGGALAEHLYFEAAKLGWNLLPSYGCTECASQIATASIQSVRGSTFPKLEILTHCRTALTEQQCLRLQSPSLLTAYAFMQDGKLIFEDPKVEGWFITEDRVLISDNFLTIIGRNSDFIKIGGESVSMTALEEKWAAVKPSFDTALFAMPDERLGYVVHLVTVQDTITPFVQKFNEVVNPYERIRQVHQLQRIPRSPLGKLLLKDLLKDL